MWGSDVGQSPQAFDDMIALAHAAAAGLTPAVRDAVLGGTAERLFAR
jgi:predicted TIM-barrel fold metal-dependent hydrolase